MQSTVLALINDVLGEINQPALSSLTIAPQQSTTQLIKNIEMHARSLRMSRVWPQQKKIFTFNTTSGRSKYPLPQDYFAALPGTAWDDSRQWRLLGPMSDMAFTDRTRGIVTSSIQTGYRVFGPDFNPTTSGGQFMVDPTPSSAFELSFEYISGNTFLPPHWIVSEAVTTTTYRNANGANWKLKTNGTTSATTPPAIPSTITADVTDGSAVWNVHQPAYDRIITNNDLCLFDDEVMQAGLKWRFLKIRGLDYQEEKIEAEKFITLAVNRLSGTIIGQMDRPKTGINNRRFTPQGGWPL